MKTSTSLPISLHISINTDFSFLLVLMEGVNFPGKASSLCSQIWLKPRIDTLGNPYDQTYLYKPEIVLIFISLVFTSPWFPCPFSLPTDSRSHILSVFVFLTHGDDGKVILRIIANFYLFFVSIYNENSPLYNRTPDSTCLYFSVWFAFDVRYTNKKSSLLLILKVFPL